MAKDRDILANLIKNWAQDHDHNYDWGIADPDPTDLGVEKTGSFFSWFVQEKKANVDLLSLLDRLELFIENKNRRNMPDGMHCNKCHYFYEFSEPNQPDGTLLCYSCRSNPYR